MQLSKTHLIFGLAASPFRYFVFFSLMSLVAALMFLFAGTIRLLQGETSIFLAILSCIFFIIGGALLVSAFISMQLQNITKEVWLLRQQLEKVKVPPPK